MKNGQALHTSPYVTQIEKYADSIKQLSRTFLHLEEKKSAFSNEEIEDMFDGQKKEPAKAVKKCSWCWEEDFVHTYQMGYEVLSAIDHYGSELNTETKRKASAEVSAVGSVFYRRCWVHFTMQDRI